MTQTPDGLAQMIRENDVRLQNSAVLLVNGELAGSWGWWACALSAVGSRGWASRRTLDQLETFVAVSRARSFSRAAAWSTAQPTLSGRIATLEREVGVSLFHRHGHTLELTESGRALLPYAERMLALRAEGLREAQRVARGGLGRLTLGVNPTCGQYVAPRLVEAYARAHPQERVWVRVERSPVLMESLLDGAVQLALCSVAQMDPRAETVLALQRSAAAGGRARASAGARGGLRAGRPDSPHHHLHAHGSDTLRPEQAAAR